MLRELNVKVVGNAPSSAAPECPESALDCAQIIIDMLLVLREAVPSANESHTDSLGSAGLDNPGSPPLSSPPQPLPETTSPARYSSMFKDVVKYRKILCVRHVVKLYMCIYGILCINDKGSRAPTLCITVGPSHILSTSQHSLCTKCNF